jgi:hypothetical protein
MHFIPVFAVKFEGLHEALVLFVCPTACIRRFIDGCDFFRKLSS